MNKYETQQAAAIDNHLDIMQGRLALPAHVWLAEGLSRGCYAVRTRQSTAVPVAPLPLPHARLAKGLSRGLARKR